MKPDNIINTNNVQTTFRFLLFFIEPYSYSGGLDTLKYKTNDQNELVPFTKGYASTFEDYNKPEVHLYDTFEDKSYVFNYEENDFFPFKRG